MNDVSEATREETKPSPKKTSCSRVTSPGLRDLGQCAEGDQLKQEYDFTLEEWRKRSQPQVRPFVEGQAGLVFQLREEALTGEERSRQSDVRSSSELRDLQAKEVKRWVPSPISFVSRRGNFGGYEVIGWRYTEGAAWHIKSGRKNRHQYEKAYVVTDGEFDPETAIVNEKIAILTLIGEWEAGLSQAATDFLDISKPD